ncbi:hypothetical protein [Inhella gelatinilytica]|uniref:Uncharacterized protein n=1 Tax=Inhella gelatinilytica TaxID=2795030 RepID=A0A931NEH9_9BURK|nr:hypothetical protein [Inhella gelatinilytica]MBH9554177.1 hypothetical protein [Inhella gelatinilytica]
MLEPRYFSFDRSDTTDGMAVLEGLASVRPADTQAAREEAQRLIGDLAAQAPGPQGPIEEGGVWSWDLTEQVEGDWLSLHLTVVGPPEWLASWWNEASTD